MTLYYCSPYGNDSNTGLGPDASNATNRPWLTLGKALNTGSPVVPGDTVYIAPGTLFEGASISPIAGVSSAGSPTAIRGDPRNEQGFKDLFGVALPMGVAHVTTRSVADGLDGPHTVTTSLFTPATGCDGLQFYDLFPESSPRTSTNACAEFPRIDGNVGWLFQDCVIQALSVIGVTAAGSSTAGRNWTVRRCEVFGSLLRYGSAAAAATADADLAILFEHNEVYGAASSGSLAMGSNAGNKAGGILYKGNTFHSTPGSGTGISLLTTTTQVSVATPIRLEGNLFVVGSVNAGTLGQVVDDGNNRFGGSVAHTNFVPAPTSKNGFAAHMVLPSRVKWGIDLPRADWFGWSDQAPSTVKFTDWANTGADFRGLTARPWAAGASIGAHEAGIFLQDTTSRVTGGGTTSLGIYGAGEYPLAIAVDAVPTTITIVTESVAYVGTNWPQIIVQANPGLGITAQAATATSAAEQTLTIGPITPTGSGVLLVRLVSRNGQKGGQTNFDVFQAA